VRVDRQVRTVTHNAAGQVVNDGKFEYRFDPRGELAVVLRNGQPVESYLYDEAGRLAAVLPANPGQPAQAFAYDGVQMVAAFNTANQPLWEAAWGPGVDRLIRWRNLAAAPTEFIPVADNRNSVVGAWQPAAARVK
jgi:hypothetical protein